jgi:nucleotide-binding universal stress UspA family protein
MDISQVVVGVDGSEPSRAAVRWAAREAARRGVDLVVMHVFDWRRAGYAEAAREMGQGIVAGATAEARSAAPGVRVSSDLTTGHAAQKLMDRSTGDTLIAVGQRGRGGFASLLLGSVSHQVATHAVGPIVVVRGRARVASGAVVVGIDGSAASAQTLGRAFDEAAGRGATLMVVHACPRTTPPWRSDPPPNLDEDVVDRGVAQQILADEIAPWREKFPDVVVDSAVVDGHPVEVLTGQSRSAQLVVVGARGHAGFADLRLGAVSTQVLHHADCPVLIVRAPVEG